MIQSFRDVEAQVAQLRERGLPPQQFEAALNQLQVGDAQGSTWQISPATGDWISWDGTAWKPGNPYGDAFDNAAAQYRSLAASLKAKQVDRQTFTTEVQQIRVEAPDGSQWAILPQNGTWVRWDGTKWIEGEPPRTGADGHPSEQESEFAACAEVYTQLRQQFQVGELSEDEFEARVTEMRITDAGGAIWQMAPQDGSWLKWNGQTWTPATPPMQSSTTAGPARKFAGAVVEGTKEELKSTIKSIPGMIFRALISRAIMAITAFYGSMYLHAWIAGFKNNGFRDDGGPWAPWLVLTESKQGNSYAFIWGIAGMLLTSLVFTIFRRGPIKGVLSVFTAPFAMIGRLKDSGRTGFGAIAIGAGVALLVNHKLSVNPQASLSMGIGLLFIGAGRPGYYAARFLYGVIRRVMAPFQKKASEGVKSKIPFDLKAAQLALFGVAPGFYLASKLPPDKLIVIGLIMTVIGLALVFNLKKPAPTAGAAVTFLFYGVFGSLAFFLFEWLTAEHAHADDGGRDEFTGNPDDYWKTEGGKLLDHSRPAADATATGAALGGDITQPPDPPPPYSFTLCLDQSSMTVTQSGPQAVRAYVLVSGPDADVCAKYEAELNAAIQMGITGNITEWFSPTVEADSGGARCNFFIEIPDDLEKRKGPHVAYVSASANSPRGMLTRRCRINMEIQADYALILGTNELKVKANEPGSALYAFVQCNDPNLEGDAQLARSRQLAPGIKFNLTGTQANWVGGPGEVQGYISAEGKEIAVNATVPSEDVTASPPFEVQVDVSCEVAEAGVLTKGGRIAIEPPDWFVELVPIKDKLTLDFKDAAEFKVRLIPLDSSKLELYGGESGNTLNQYLKVSAEGANAQYLVMNEKDGDGAFRLFDVTFSEAASGVQVDPYVDIVTEATLTGKQVSQKFRINLFGKPTLEVKEHGVGIRAGGDPVDVHIHVKDGADLSWSLNVEILRLDQVEPAGPPETLEDNNFVLKLRGSELPEGDLEPHKGTLKLTAHTTNKETGEEMATDPVEVDLTLGSIGLSISPTIVHLPLDPKTQPATEFKVRVIAYDATTETFKPDTAAMKGLNLADWEDGDFSGGGNVFKGAKVEVKFVRFDGSGDNTVAIWSAKQEIPIPALQTIDALREIEASGAPDAESALFVVRQQFAVPADPASLAAERIRVEQENCRKTLKYLPDGDTKTKFSEAIERDYRTLGAEGLYHLRHEIWEAAQKALTEEAESYLTSARVIGAAETALDWVNYVCGLIVQGMSSILVPFPGDFVVGLLYQAIPEMVNAIHAGKTAEAWVKEWVGGLVAGAPGMAVDIGMGQVVDIEKLFLRGIAEYKDPRKAAGMACLIFWESRFLRYQVTTKPDGEPFSLKESITSALRDLGENIVTLGIGRKTKAAMGGTGGAKVTDDSTLADPDHGYDPKDGRRYEPGKGQPDTRGMPDKNVKAAQDIASKHDVEIYIRPTNPASKALLEAGAHPKPELIKTKTINEQDLKLGRQSEDLGKAGYFDPGPEPPPRGNMSEGDYNDLKDRWKQRSDEFKDYAHKMEDLTKKGYKIDDNGVILHPDGKPFTGDHDIFDIRGPNGERVSKEKYDAVMNDLKKPPFSAQHDGHRQWDYSGESKTPKAGETKSEFDKKKTVDTKILDSHSTETPKGKPGEALIRVGADGKIDAQHFNQSSRQPTLTSTQQKSQSAQASTRHDQAEKDK